MPLPPDLLERSAGEGARLIARGLLDRVRSARKHLAKARDPEALHDFRVALRRLRSWVRAYRSGLGKSVPKRARRTLRELASATSAGRDAEVQLEWLERAAGGADAGEQAGITWLAGRLEERRAQAYRSAVQEAGGAFDRLEKVLRVRLGRETGEAAGLFGPFTAALLRGEAAELEARLEAIGTPPDEAQAHAARIRGKRLRYLLEPLKTYREQVPPLIQRLRAFQDLLGELHDLHVLAGDLARGRAPAAARSGLVALSRRAAAREEELFGELRASWLGSRSSDFFAEVEQVARSLRVAVSAKPPPRKPGETGPARPAPRWRSVRTTRPAGGATRPDR